MQMETSNFDLILQAESDFKKAIELSPNYPDPYLRLGYFYFDLGKYKEALVSLNKFLVFKPEHAVALSRKYVCLSKLDKQVKK